MNKYFALLVFIFSISSYAKNPKNIFLFIGDGMGIAHLALTERYLEEFVDKEGLAFTKFPVAGFSKTYAHNKYITDSAAAGTAIATGFKTNFNTVAISVEGENLTSMAKHAKNKGKKVGIISNTNLNDATPSAFYANQNKRHELLSIAKQISKSNFDFFAGGGFLDDEDDIAIKSLIKNNYKYTYTIEDFNKLNETDQKIYARCPNLENQSACMFSIDYKDSDIKLSEFTHKAVKLLANKKGFFIMVEAGVLDWAAHANDAYTVIHEIIEFNNAIKVALDFYRKNPKDTLIVVVSDHETGGLSLGFKDTKYEMYLDRLRTQKISREEFIKVLQNLYKEKNPKFKDVLPLLEQYFGLNKNSFNKKELKDLDLALKQSVKDSRKPKKNKYNEDVFAAKLIEIFNNRAGLAWATTSHTAVPTPIFAIGVGADKFGSYLDNTDIGKILIDYIK